MACGGNKYDDEIDASILTYKETYGEDAKKVTRKNSAVLIYDDGKYVGVAGTVGGQVIEPIS
ncbi:hypothetical protein HCJ66_14860 [Listeria sp. FSL L7-1582]|uniref:hypothetical protein n=1 Tax=Listeria portnoyi TaxID=2713504 RepID=UPI00164CE47F|nr:hypothetical protein [Listeria portnoyi]MBC6310819.1 hypothetical protein [Listeria portnoyi]